ncbi:Cupredoxin [Trametopsis cervina]|nr:Cupredoxin [Trametopsis cervina]
MLPSAALLLSLAAATSATFTHFVAVSNSEATLVFTPPVTHAKPGDFVHFTFHAKNHSIEQVSFADPCGSVIPNGFNSGFHPVAATAKVGLPTFVIPVTNSAPIWIKCGQGAGTDKSHCGAGMVAAINPPATGNTFAKFKQAAIATISSGTGSLSSPPPATTFHVTVGANGQLAYNPPSSDAKPGDIVEFSFYPKNHTVTQSSFNDPCSPLAGGFDSGFNPVAATATGAPPTFRVTVNDTKPIWFYCRQGENTAASHCKQGMVGAINAPPSGNTFDAFKAKAVSSTPTAPAPPAAATFHVTVGANGQLAYNPPTSEAKVGDVVEFSFFPKNHTITQSSFDQPCKPLAGGFDSGFHPVAANSTDPAPPFQFIVKDTKPVWFYCRQGENTPASHCQQGMVGAINAPATGNTFDAFKKEALALGSSSSNSTSSTSSQTFYVEVGANGQLQYTPPSVNAKPGDVVEFKFNPKNHTVTQASFTDPCSPLAGGFDSGFQPVAANSTSPAPTFRVTVTDTKPLWFYCRQGAHTNVSHCGQGMVGAVNAPPTGNTFDAFKQKALDLGKQFGVGSTSTSAPPPGQTHVVQVSNSSAALQFFPPVTTAAIGDIVEFHFNPKNHSVTQSLFQAPCASPYGGFDSGFQPVALGATGPVFSIRVNDTKPIFFHCNQGLNTAATHCGKGMVGAINPSTEQPYSTFRGLALAQGFVLGAVPASALTNWGA